MKSLRLAVLFIGLSFLGLLQFQCSSSGTLNSSVRNSESNFVITNWDDAPKLEGLLVGPIPLTEEIKSRLMRVLREGDFSGNMYIQVGTYLMLTDQIPLIKRYVESKFGEIIQVNERVWMSENETTFFLVAPGDAQRFEKATVYGVVLVFKI